MELPDDWLEAIVNLCDDAETEAVALFGSYARGDANVYSDVDIVRFAVRVPEAESDRYTLRHIEGRLVSFAITTLAEKRADLTRPESAVWVVPALRQARILLDKTGGLAELRQAALGFRWDALQTAADAWTSWTVMGFAEEVHKVLAALPRGDDGAALYAAWGIVLGMARALTVQRGTLIESDNRFFQQAQQTAGTDSVWSACFRRASGLAAVANPPVVHRARAALALYRETARLLDDIIQPAHRDVIENALAKAEGFGYNPPPCV